jgi:hypothetical protein
VGFLSSYVLVKQPNYEKARSCKKAGLPKSGCKVFGLISDFADPVLDVQPAQASHLMLSASPVSQ